MLPLRRHTRCLVHAHVRSVQGCKLVSGAQALPGQARMCSSQCVHACGTSAHPASAHECTCMLCPTDTRLCSVQVHTHTHTNTHSAQTDTCIVTADACVCVYTRCWILPVLTQGCVVFLLSFLRSPSSALCRSLVCLLLSSQVHTSQRHPHAELIWTVMDALSKVAISLFCTKNA